MGIEPRPDSRYVIETMGYARSCRPKPSRIYWPKRKYRDRSARATAVVMIKERRIKPTSEGQEATSVMRLRP